jgi:tetratricopeptide (TPR) repeat protein
VEEAVSAYRRAVAVNPRYSEAWTNLGNALRDQGEMSAAVEAYEQAAAIAPSSPEVLNNLGVAYKELDRLDDAITCYRRALAAKPSHVEAHNNLGLALMEDGQIPAAIASFEQALSLRPDYPAARYNLGLACLWAGQENRAVVLLWEAARAKHDHRGKVSESFVYRSRLKHDVEQIEYLQRQGVLGVEVDSYRDALRRLRKEVDSLAAPGNRVPIPPTLIEMVAPSFNALLHVAPCERLPDCALNPELDASAVEERYYATHPEVTHIDHLLKPEALDRLRRFCWESTIWKKDYENGYIGAFLGDGFATPLLFQIATELRLKFPRIFKEHRLTQAWAFKQDSTRRGLNIHADAAAVNVNFWITADDANLNPNAGGLVVWDKEAPRHWNFKTYNSERNRPKILEWLRQVGGQTVRIPYRANRAVVFNSDLFHETDEVSFKDDYTSRRINITLLYGYRLKD